MNEQERINALKQQRRLAERKAREADGTLKEERRRVREQQIREQRIFMERKKRQRQAMIRIITLGVALVVIVVLILSGIRKAGKGNQNEISQSTPSATSPINIESAYMNAETEIEFGTSQVQTEEETAAALTEEAEMDSVTEPVTEVAAAAVSVGALEPGQVIDPSGIVIPDWITVDLIHINEVSRPAIALDAVNDIAIHYVANPQSTAKANRDYFDSLDNPLVEGAGRQASAHLIVGLEGEVVQCIPLNEIAYAVHSRNSDTISIEVCHPDETGKFSDVTYQTVVKLTAWLLQQTGLTPEHVIRHYDCDGKACPLYYVENEDAWLQLKQDIAIYYYGHPNIQ